MPADPDLSRPTRSPIRIVNYVLLWAAVVVLLVWARLTLVALLVGVGFGVILAPQLERMQRGWRIPKGIAAALVAVLGIGAIGAIGWAFANMVDAQAALLAERMPDLVKSLQQQINGLFARYPWIQRNLASMDLMSNASAVGTAVFKGAWSGMNVVLALVFALVIGLYVAVDAGTYRQGLVRALPAPQRERGERFLREAADAVRNWFGAQLLDMLIIGSLTSIGLLLVGAEYWLLLGVLTGVLGIIPYVGILIVVIFAALVTVASDASRLPWVLGVFFITQQLEGNLVLPLVMRGRAKLPAVPLMVIMLLLGSWAGLLGVLIAPPLFAVLRLAYIEFWLPRVDAPGAQGQGEVASPPVCAAQAEAPPGAEPRALPAPRG
jgi:predicted PurR-regulated permease PerM